MTRAEFATEAGVTVWGKYAEIFRTIDEGATKVSIRSCNGAGKTKLLATLFAYELWRADQQLKREEAKPPSERAHVPSLKIICTAATATQLKNSLWAECKRMCRKAHIPVSAHARDIALDADHVAIAVNPAKIESGQGYHADRIVIFVDEASGFSLDMLNALFSNATGADSLTVMTFNPLDTDAAVYELEESDQSFHKFTISAFEHPNVIAGSEVIVGAVTRNFILTQLEMNSYPTVESMPGAIATPWMPREKQFWHPTPEAMARICGEWSLAVAHGFIPMSELLAACKEEGFERRGGLRAMGIDVAATGQDKTVLTIFYGNEQMAYESFQTGEFATVAARIHQSVRDHGCELVCIDDTGIGNAVTDRLQGIADFGALIIPVNFASKPKGFEPLRKPANARAEMYMCLEREVRSRAIKLLYLTGALKELAAARMVPMKGSENIRLEDKIGIKRRLGRSPDHADAVALARYGVRLLQFFNQKRMF